jgi:hypothetical protein
VTIDRFLRAAIDIGTSGLHGRHFPEELPSSTSVLDD